MTATSWLVAGGEGGAEVRRPERPQAGPRSTPRRPTARRSPGAPPSREARRHAPAVRPAPPPRPYAARVLAIPPGERTPETAPWPRVEPRQGVLRPVEPHLDPPTLDRHPIGQARQLCAHGLGGHLEPESGQPGRLEFGDQARSSLLLDAERRPRALGALSCCRSLVRGRVLWLPTTLSMGLAGSWAAGAVLVDGDEPARFDQVTIGRAAIFTGGRPVHLPPPTRRAGAGSRTRSTGRPVSSSRRDAEADIAEARDPSPMHARPRALRPGARAVAMEDALYDDGLEVTALRRRAGRQGRQQHRVRTRRPPPPKGRHRGRRAPGSSWPYVGSSAAPPRITRVTAAAVAGNLLTMSASTRPSPRAAAVFRRAVRACRRPRRSRTDATLGRDARSPRPSPQNRACRGVHRPAATR